MEPGSADGIVCKSWWVLVGVGEVSVMVTLHLEGIGMMFYI